MKKKAQIEMFGLVIIVVIIAIIALFAIKFLIIPSENLIEEKLTISSNNLFNALLKTTICEKKSVLDIIKSCYLNENICNMNSCELSKNKIERILELSYPHNPYKFEAFADNSNVLAAGECDILKEDVTKVISAQPYFIYSHGVNFEFRLSLCK